VKVARQFQEVRLLLADNGFVAVLEEMALSPVPSIVLGLNYSESQISFYPEVFDHDPGTI
jgi:hypothetical protein